jgi:hypothetical protein
MLIGLLKWIWKQPKITFFDVAFINAKKLCVLAYIAKKLQTKLKMNAPTINIMNFLT